MAIYKLGVSMQDQPIEATERIKSVLEHLPGWGLVLQQITVMAGVVMIALDGTMTAEQAAHVEVEPV